MSEVNLRTGEVTKGTRRVRMAIGVVNIDLTDMEPGKTYVVPTAFARELVYSNRAADVTDEIPAAPAEVPLEDRKRDDLNALAAALGVEKPADLANKGAVIEAIRARQKPAA
jgi:hypothetical protein